MMVFGCGSPPSALPGISPSRGEIQMPLARCQICNVRKRFEVNSEPISPLEGEMPGRAAGRVTRANLTIIAPNNSR
ncbi:hypothetical protein ATO67_03695 [Agrobacterium bohemicum]|uniref:Propionyl-coenzyme A carboxylase alpha polypeptide n=1 Tax=Agrobacterium bohemicum TaxID=2052828 RepID=A0A135P4C8_9HYPH|nr:hypothetical protein ATO67_03695 [Agrobacterium bohemicum]